MAEIYEINEQQPHFRVPIQQGELVLPVANVRDWIKAPRENAHLVPLPLARQLVREWYEQKTGEHIDYIETDLPLSAHEQPIDAQR